MSLKVSAFVDTRWNTCAYLRAERERVMLRPQVRGCQSTIDQCRSLVLEVVGKIRPSGGSGRNSRETFRIRQYLVAVQYE